MRGKKLSIDSTRRIERSLPGGQRPHVAGTAGSFAGSPPCSPPDLDLTGTEFMLAERRPNAAYAY
jgi:hypothetical protein